MLILLFKTLISFVKSVISLSSLFNLAVKASIFLLYSSTKLVYCLLSKSRDYEIFYNKLSINSMIFFDLSLIGLNWGSTCNFSKDVENLIPAFCFVELDFFGRAREMFR